ncbi:MAG TPA: hypothetical protein VLG39_05505, partial [Nitrospirota bacterium]|nr:hypothetical protein [Nitrospirota bacterium]
KGPIAGATVQAFAIRSNVTDTVPLGQAKTDNKGIYTIETFGYKGPIVVEATGGAYNDEISGAQVTLKTPLRAMFSSVGTGTTTISVTPLTELAAKNAEGHPVLTGDVIDAANIYVAHTFSIANNNIVTSVPNAFSTDANETSYAAALKIFSQLVIDSMEPGEMAAGQTMDDALATVMTSLGNEQLQTTVFSAATISSLDFATNLCNSATGCTATPPSTTPPPLNPVGGIVKLASVAPAGTTIFQITMTIALPPGVTVNTSAGSNQAAGISVNLTRLLDPKTTTLTALVTQSTLTTPGKVDIVVGATKAISPGQFLTINFNLDPTVPLPAVADFAETGILIQGLKLVTLNNVTLSTALTFL